MKGDALAATQLLMAQAIFGIAEHLAATTGMAMTPVPYAELPNPAKPGMIGVVSDAAIGEYGIVTGGGTRMVLVLYDNDGDWVAVPVRGVGGAEMGTATWAQLSSITPKQGMIACLIDSNRNGYGQVITGSGPYIVLAMFDGTDWVVH